MRMALTAVDPARGVSGHVLVDADADTPVGEIGRALGACLGTGVAAAAGTDADWPVYVDGLAVDPRQRLAAAPLREGSVVSLGSAAGCAPTAEPVGVVEVRVVGGPGAGVVHRLGPGEFQVGTGDGCAVPLADPMVAPIALVLVVGADGSCAARPAGVGAGFDEVLLDGAPLPSAGRQLALSADPGRLGFEAREWTDGESLSGGPAGRGAPLLAVGAVLLAVTVPEPPDLATEPAAGGRWLDVNRPPRLPAVRPAGRFRQPVMPTRPDRAPVGVLMALVPAIGAGVMAFVLHSYYGLLFALLAPLSVIGARVSGGRRARRAHRGALARYRAELAGLDRAVDAALAAECAARRSAAPDPAEVLLTALGPRRRLWERRRGDPDYLRLRFGTADLPSELTVLDTSGEDRRERHRTAPDVPVAVAVAERGVVGVAGRGQLSRTIAGWLLVQAAVLHSPLDLAVCLFTSSGGARDWDWVRWLPHARDDDTCVLVGADEASRARRIGELVSLIEARASARGVLRSAPAGQPHPIAGGEGPVTWARGGRDVLVILDGARSLRALPGVVTLLRDGPSAGVYCVCLDHDVRLLPAECQAVAEQSPGGLRISEPGGPPVDDVRPDLVGATTVRDLTRGVTGSSRGRASAATWCGEVARALAPLRELRRDAEESALPTSARLLEVVGIESPTAAVIAAGWAAAPGGSTSFSIGSGLDGPFTLDLCRDGPHGLIAGTTGSGKSELLQSIVAALALANPPDALTFVLVDYKGGSAFAGCARLPHCVGLVTDLDSQLVTRALASLAAELRRRERLLARAGAKDLEDYGQALESPPPGAEGAPRLPRLPRLVIVIDEFASLARELPDFVTGLVGLAQRGRSLGVHLLLATQRPSGVVSPEIRANTNLRIALRMTDAAESVDVIDAPDAAWISRAVPGRAYARSGHASLTPFQAGRVGGQATLPRLDPRPTPTRSDQLRARPSRAAPRVVPLPWASLGVPVEHPSRADPPHGHRGTDLTFLVEQIRSAAELTGVPRQRGPWLPPLPRQLTLDALPAPRKDASVAAPGRTGTSGGLPRAGTRLAPIPIGISDFPGDQAQRAYQVDLEASGHLLVIGSARSGRSTVLRTFAGALAARVTVHDVHLYGVDCGNNALRALAALPHTGAVAGADEPDRVERLFGRLHAEIAARQEMFADRGYADLGEQRAAEPDRALPYLILLLDRYEGFLAAFEAADGGRLVDGLVRLIREGPAVGLRVLLTTDRRGLTGRVASAIENRLVLRLADRADYPLVGLPSAAIPDGLPPGRGYRIGDATAPGDAAARGPSLPVETQIALLDEDPAGRAQVAALARIGITAAARDGLPAGRTAGPRTDPRQPMRIDVLPASLTFAEAAALAAEAPTAPDMPGLVPSWPPPRLGSSSTGAKVSPAGAKALPSGVDAMAAGGRPAGRGLDRTLESVTRLPGRCAPPLSRWSPARPLVGLVGVGGDELGALTVDLARDGPGFTIAGPPGSGRSTALVTLAWALLTGGTRLVLVTPRPSPLRALVDATQMVALLDADARPDELDLLVTSGGRPREPMAVIVDDGELLADSPLAAPLAAFLRTARDNAGALVLAGTTDDLLGQFRGFLLDARRGRGGLLLSPSGPADGELFGRRLTSWVPGAVPPGRGLFFQRGRPTPVQVPLPPTLPTEHPASPRHHTPALVTPTLVPRRRAIAAGRDAGAPIRASRRALTALPPASLPAVDQPPPTGRRPPAHSRPTKELR